MGKDTGHILATMVLTEFLMRSTLACTSRFSELADRLVRR